MEHWIEITPDEVGSGPFVIYSPLAAQQRPPPTPPPTRRPPLPLPLPEPLTNGSLPPRPPNPTATPAAAGIFATGTHYGNQTVCVYRNQSREKPSARVMMQPNLFVTFD